MAGKAVTAVAMLAVMEAVQVVTVAVMAAAVLVPGVHLIHQHDLQHHHVVVSVTLAESMAVVADAVVVVAEAAVLVAEEETKVNSKFCFSSPLIGYPIRN